MTTDMTQHIPFRNQAQCFFCGETLDVTANGVYRLVTGWVKNRSEGGGHAIALPRRHDSWAHGVCVTTTTGAEQEALFQ